MQVQTLVLLIPALACLATIGSPLSDAAQSAELLRLSVKGFNAPVAEWVAYAELDLGELAAVSGTAAQITTENIEVWEISEAGEVIALRQSVFYPRATGRTAGILFWLMEGPSQPGATRTFSVRAGQKDAQKAPSHARPVTLRQQGDRFIVRNHRYEVVHDAKKGGTIVEIAFPASGRRVPVQMRDGARSQEWHYVSNDAQPEIRILGDESGSLGAVIEVRARMIHEASPREACPQVQYRYIYTAHAPIIHIESVFPGQTLKQRFSTLRQCAFGVLEKKAFARVSNIVTSGKGNLMVTRFAWSPDEHRPPAGFLLEDGTNALAIINPVSGSFRLDAEAMHVESRGYVDIWLGERLALTAGLCVSEAKQADAYIPLAEGIRVCAWVPVLTPRLEAVREKTADIKWGAQRSAIEMLLRGAGLRLESARGLKEAVELLSAAESLLKRPRPDPAPIVVQTEGFLGLANQHTGLLFRKGPKTFVLDGVFRGSHAFLGPAHEERPLWRATWKVGDRAWASTSSCEATHVQYAVERPDPQTARLTLEWPSVWAGAEQVRAKAVVTLRADDSLSRWRLALEPLGKSPGLWEITFPVVGGVVRDGDETDFLVFPYKSGVRVPNPAAAGLWEALYPGAGGWQFLAYWQGQDGLYVATHDSEAAVKKLASLPQGRGGLELRFTHPVPNMGLPGAGYELPFESVIGTFQGDWYDAAQIYRSWLVRQDWFPRKPLYANADIPQWLKDCCVATRRSGEAEGFLRTTVERHASGFEEWHTGVLDEYEALGRPPTLLWWYHAWFKKDGRQDHFNDSPDFPPVAGFGVGVRQLQSHGIRVAGYTLSHWWGYNTPSWKEEGAERAVCINAEGKPDFYDRRGVGVMCPATKLYQEKMQRVIRKVQEDGPVDGTYFDLGGTAGASYCYAKNHGHPLGSGAFITAGKRELLRGLRQAARARNPEFIVIMEGNADCHLNTVDGFCMFEENVPLRMALYADYLRTAGSKRCDWEREPVEALVAAKQFAWGCLVGRFTSKEMNKGKDLVPEKVAYYRNLVWHKYVARPWLNLGRMLRPLKITDVHPPDPAEFVEGTMVPSGVWQAPDASVAFVFANARHSTEVSFRYGFDPATYGIPTDGSMPLYRLTPEGEPPQPRFEKIGDLRGPIERRETLPGGGVLILVAKAKGP